jgi:hypothetical protein
MVYYAKVGIKKKNDRQNCSFVALKSKKKNKWTFYEK